MGKLIVHWLIHALALYIVAKLLPGVRLLNFGSALLAVVLIALVNAIIKPIIVLLTLPFTVITLGLFLFVINACMLMIVSMMSSGFKIDSFGTAIVASILLTLVTTLLETLIK